MIEIAILYVVLGILIKYGKMYFLIAGYNTKTKEDQEKYDIEGIATVFRNVMFGMAFILIIGYFSAKWTGNPDFQDYSLWVSLIIGVPYLLIKSNSKKYKKNQNKSD